jgi:hypothetical protein
MTEPSDLARRAANVLGSAASASRPVAPSDEARAIARVAGAIRARRERARWRWWASAVAAVAAAAAVGVVFGVAKRGALSDANRLARTPAAAAPAAVPAEAMVEAVVGDAYVIHGDQGHSVVKGSPVDAGDRIVVQRGGHVAFVLPSGTRVAIDEGTDLSIVAAGAMQLFRLGAGSMQAEVQKLGPAERFVVRTRDGEIEVRGTSFRLSDTLPDIACGGGTTTRLSVYEGVVAVRIGAAEVNVSAGEAWPMGCEPRTSGEAPSGSAAPPPAGPVSRTVAQAPRGADAARPQLAEQNDMYERAIAARGRGDADGAIAAFDGLIAKYPSCPLAENAFAERMKVLAAVNHRRATEAARDYLARYPSGFARDDAETILRGGAGDR